MRKMRREEFDAIYVLMELSFPEDEFRPYEEQKARNLLAELGLAWERGKPVRDWSGGMRRRLALARALLLPFDVLTLDEPFTGLDRENRQRCQECIRQRADGKTVLLVTHDVADAVGLNAGIITLAS